MNRGPQTLRSVRRRTQATDEKYLRPLRLFERRVLYANVFHDLQVPFCTSAVEHTNPHRGGGAVLSRDRSPELAAFPSIVAAVVRPASTNTAADLAVAKADTGTLVFARDGQGAALREMVAGLNSVGWEKYHCLLSPSAHHQIVANSVWTFGRDVPGHIVDQMLG